MEQNKDYLFIKSLNLAKSNPSKVGLMILFDIMFLVSIFILQTLFRYFAQSLVVERTLLFGLIFLVFTVLYYAGILLLVYSFFKYCILDFIKSLFDKREFSLNRLGQFYLLNSVLFLPTFTLFNALLGSIKEIYRPYIFVVVGTPLSIFLYIVLNTSHSLFYEGASIKESIKKSFKITFTKIKIYRETILFMILVALLLGLLFLGSGYLIRFLTSKNYNLYLNVYIYFKQASIIVFDIVFYLVILINRISFYLITKEFFQPSAERTPDKKAR